MWNLRGPGIKPVFPILAGGFLTTVPPGKSSTFLFIPEDTEVQSRWRNGNSGDEKEGTWGKFSIHFLLTCLEQLLK